MKLRNLLSEARKKLLEKKEAIATSSHTNLTMHFNDDFVEVGPDGKPELTITISVSSTGGKDFKRNVGDKIESVKMSEALKLEFRRALRRFDKNVQEIVAKYKLHSATEEEPAEEPVAPPAPEAPVKTKREPSQEEL